MRHEASQAQVEDFRLLLQTLDGDQFELFVARLWWLFGWDVDLTQESHDGGIDVWARRQKPDGTTETIAIQAKAESDTIPVGEVRKYASLQLLDSVDFAVLVTTSDFTGAAEKQAAPSEMDLKTIDGEQLCRIILEYGWQESFKRFFWPDD